MESDPVVSPGIEWCHRVADLPVIGALGMEHWWIRHDGQEAGMGPAGGEIPGHGGVDSPYVTETTLNDHAGEGDGEGAVCEPVENLDPTYADVDPDCVDAEIAQVGRDTGRWSPVNQCHDAVEEILDRCDPTPTPWWECF